MKYKGGDKVIITLPIATGSEKENSVVNESDERKGILSSRRRNEYLPRRKKTNNFGIRIFDGSYYLDSGGVGFEIKRNRLANGSDEVSIVEHLSLVNEVFAHFGQLKNTGDLITEYAAEFRAYEYFPFDPLIFTSKAVYRTSDSLRTPSNEYYKLNWKKNGLELSEDELNVGLRIYYPGFFQTSFRIGFQNNPNKITTTLNYNADGINFKCSAQMDIALIPEFIKYTATSTYADYTVTPYLFGEITAAARIMTDFAKYRYEKNHPLYLKSYRGVWIRNYPFPIGTVENYYEDYKAAVNGELLGLDTKKLVSLARYFPAPPRTPYDLNGYGGTKVELKANAPSNAGHYPVAIIKQDNKFYYVWS